MPRLERALHELANGIPEGLVVLAVDGAVHVFSVLLPPPLDLALVAAPERLPENLLQHLPVGAARERVGDHDRLRGLDSAEPLAAVRDQLHLDELSAGVELHDRGDGLAPVFVRDSDDGTVLYRRMRPDDLLDLARIDVEPA